MKTSKRGIDLIKNFESLVLHSYQDSAGIWTIGYGSTMYKSGDKVGAAQKITIDQAEELLRWEIGLKEVGVNEALRPHIVNQNHFDALVSFTYNVGIGGLKSSTLLKKIKGSTCDPSIKDEFLKWNKISYYITENGKKVKKYKVLDGLTRRRQREAELFFTKTEL